MSKIQQPRETQRECSCCECVRADIWSECHGNGVFRHVFDSKAEWDADAHKVTANQQVGWNVPVVPSDTGRCCVIVPGAVCSGALRLRPSRTASAGTQATEHLTPTINRKGKLKHKCKIPWCSINGVEGGVRGRLLSAASLKRAVTQNQHALKTLLEKMLLAQLPLF